MDIGASQAVRRGDQHPLKANRGGEVSQAIQPGSVEAGTAISVVSENMLAVEAPALG